MQPKFDTIFAKKVRKNASKPTGKSYLKKRGMKKERNVVIIIQNTNEQKIRNIKINSIMLNNFKSLASFTVHVLIFSNNITLIILKK